MFSPRKAENHGKWGDGGLAPLVGPGCPLSRNRGNKTDGRTGIEQGKKYGDDAPIGRRQVDLGRNRRRAPRLPSTCARACRAGVCPPRPRLLTCRRRLVRRRRCRSVRSEARPRPDIAGPFSAPPFSGERRHAVIRLAMRSAVARSGRPSGTAWPDRYGDYATGGAGCGRRVPHHRPRSPGGASGCSIWAPKSTSTRTASGRWPIAWDLINDLIRRRRLMGPSHSRQTDPPKNPEAPPRRMTGADRGHRKERVVS